MLRLRELAFRTTNAGLLASLGWLHRRYGKGTTYKVGQDGAAALFEDSWFSYSPKNFGCTGNIDFHGDAENATRHELFKRIKGDEVFFDIGAHGGVYTVTLLKRFPKLVVHSFEPQAEEMLENMRLNDLFHRAGPPGCGRRKGEFRSHDDQAAIEQSRQRQGRSSGSHGQIRRYGPARAELDKDRHRGAGIASPQGHGAPDKKGATDNHLRDQPSRRPVRDYSLRAGRLLGEIGLQSLPSARRTANLRSWRDDA